MDQGDSLTCRGAMEFETLPDSPVQRQLRQRFSEFHLVLSGESDRGILLTGAAALEVVLEEILRSRFAAVKPKPKSVIDPLFNSMGPLSNFAAKMKLCYASDYIHEWVYRDLEIIRTLRNETAHSFENFSLSSGKCLQRIERLTSAKIAQKIFRRAAPLETANKQELRHVPP
jgi:DNA-binding MltR family transcriptional regulator